jgi:membrane associated rhomboid family serine protease
VTARRLTHSVTTQAVIVFVCVLVAWAVELVDRTLYGGTLEQLGIRPRSAAGLWGIPAAPLLHAGWAHLAANTVPFIVLAWLVLVRGLSDFVVVTVMVVMLGGLGVWLFGRPNTDHIGASGLIFGYLGYLLARGYFERNLPSILLAVVVAVAYGGALWGLLPGQPGVSWEGHVFGFAAGVGAGKLLSTPRLGAGRSAGA